MPRPKVTALIWSWMPLGLDVQLTPSGEVKMPAYPTATKRSFPKVRSWHRREEVVSAYVCFQSSPLVETKTQLPPGPPIATNCPLPKAARARKTFVPKDRLVHSIP